MDKQLLDHLLKIRKLVVKYDNDKPKYRLVSFVDTTMAKDTISGTPFRTFESVPQERMSKRRQNDSMSFDPYIDTLFDYPIVVNNALGGRYDDLKKLNWHLTLQIPFCGMDCWHCYNDKRVCSAGFSNLLEIQGDESPLEMTAEEILETFMSCKKQGKSEGRIYNVLRVSGGEPFMAIELIAELLQLIGKNNKDRDYPLAIWTETNLISWAETEDGESVVKISCDEAKKNSLDIKSIFSDHGDKLIIHPCFHGLTDENLQQCTGNKRIRLEDLHSGFTNLHEFMSSTHTSDTNGSPNIFPTFIAEASNPSGVKSLFNFLYKTHPSYPLKLAVISVDAYGPVEQRMATRKEQNKRFYCYAKNSSLKRWDEMIKSKYALSYGQIPRSFADHISKNIGSYSIKDIDNTKYKPMLILLKSVYRDKYRQDILTILSAPSGILFSTTYDTRHIEPSTLICLKGGVSAFGLSSPD